MNGFPPPLSLLTKFKQECVKTKTERKKEEEKEREDKADARDLKEAARRRKVNGFLIDISVSQQLYTIVGLKQVEMDSG